MNVQKVIQELQVKYPGKSIKENNEKYPTEIICEIDVPSDPSQGSLAIAIIDASIPHYHKKTTEVYKVLQGELTVYKNNKEYMLKEGDTLTINPTEIHYARGNETWITCLATPAWKIDDHILVPYE